MNFDTALFIYLVTVLFVFFLSRSRCITIWSSSVLAMVTGLIVLSLVCPISSIERVLSGELAITVYFLLFFITIIVALWYLVIKAFNDRTVMVCERS